MNINGIEYPIKVRLGSYKALRSSGVDPVEASLICGTTQWARFYTGACYVYVRSICEELNGVW